LLVAYTPPLHKDDVHVVQHISRPEHQLTPRRYGAQPCLSISLQGANTIPGAVGGPLLNIKHASYKPSHLHHSPESTTYGPCPLPPTPPPLLAAPLTQPIESNLRFSVGISIVVATLDNHGNLLWTSSANPSNNFHFGAEAPSAIVSTYFGDDFTYLKAFQDGKGVAYAPGKKTWCTGAQDIPPVQVIAEDCNQLSPLPCGSTHFYFCALRGWLCIDRVNAYFGTALHSWRPLP
jgi:hypothetical protein